MVNYPYFETVQHLLSNWERNRQPGHLQDFLAGLVHSHTSMQSCLDEINAKAPALDDDEVIASMREDHKKAAELIAKAQAKLAEANK